MVDIIMKKLELVQQQVLNLQIIRQNWTGKTISNIEIFITYDDILSVKNKTESLLEEFFLKKTSTTDKAHEQAFETIIASVRTLQVNVGELKKKREDAAVARTKTIPFKLEKIKLPQFSGQFSDWQDFHDLFSSAVENNNNLNDAEKMVYLKSSLIGEAATIVSSFSTATTSFMDGWDLVKKRYSNNREIVFAHIRKFDELKPVPESSSGLRKLADTINECVRSLTALTVPVSSWDVIFIYLALKKLDNVSKKEWLLTQGVDLPKLQEFINFIEKRATALADSNLSSKAKSSSSYEKSSHHVSASKSSDGKTCMKCGQGHYLHQCKVFSNLQPSERQWFVKQNNLCYNCLFKGHSVSSCKIMSVCKKCNKKHHTLIHVGVQSNKANDSSLNSTAPVSFNSSTKEEPSGSNSSSATSVAKTSSCHSESNLSSHQNQVVLFETGIGLAEDSAKQLQPCRIFFDAGSESNFITENCVDRLGLSRKKTCVQIGGIGGTEGGIANGMVSITLFSKYSNSFIQFNALIMRKITKSMPRTECKNSFSHLQGLQLADPMFHSPAPIDILIGAPLTGKVKLPGIIVGPSGQPDAQNTIFGWVLSGNAPASSSMSSYHVRAFHSSCSIHEPCLNSTLEKFWSIEEPEQKSTSCDTNEQAELHFQSTFKRTEVGRYSVRLPFKTKDIELGESKSKAIKRLYSVERSVFRNSEMYKSYHKQFQDFIANGLIEKVPSVEINSSNSYYMPHHVVSKLESSTTKYRIVFDASCKSDNGFSLNDNLLTGPKIQTDLVQILLKFRTYTVAISADIVKFYNQFCVQTPDTDYQRLVYRPSPSEQIGHYRMLRVCFGVTSAPFLAVRSLHQLAEDYRESYPLVYSILKNEFLIDNLLSGASTAEEAIEIQSQIIEVLSLAQLKLQKWASNNSSVTNSVPIEERELVPCLINEDSSIKTIGLLWNPTTDSFSVKFHKPTLRSTSSKRQILSGIARTFDPLGWLSPVTIRLKILLQCLWKENLDWDAEIPSNLYNKWHSYCMELPSLKEFSIPRCITSPSTTKFELFGFCDASVAGYAACVYLKSESKTSLIAAKTKVAPVKGETIPRLELCGAWLLSKLIHSILPSLGLNVSSVQCWTDSTIVLAWLKSTDKLPVFVNNRVRSIHQLIPKCKWNHVKGEENPADLASRGMSIQSFLNSKLWLQGPNWLSGQITETNHVSTTSEVPDNSSSYFNERILKFIQSSSDFLKIKRLIAYWIRFINQLRKKSVHHQINLTVSDLQSALLVLVRVVQQQSFADEIYRLSKQKSIMNHLKSMCLFLDDNGILRVGGRLRRGFYDYDIKHPILLPKNHHFSTIIIRYYHQLHLHAGPQLLLSILREKFWVIRGPQICAKIVRECVVCCKADPKPLHQIMGQLPEPRITPSRPFNNVGVDYAGPFYLCLIPGRNPRLIKAYVCIFVCLAVKAVHIEFSGDLTTESFIGAFRRFISRRGLPNCIYCDGGKNFLGAKNDIESIQKFLKNPIYQQQLNKFFLQQEINYHFNPPYGPHHGGIYESAVKSMKLHLKRVVMDRHLSIEEFMTLLCQVEAALNSRPITPLSSDTNDFSFLSPGHFLTGGPLLAEPQENLADVKLYQLTRWQLVQQMTQHFFRRWSKQYIQSLQKLPKWFTSQPNLGIGQMVLVQDPESEIGPQQWNLGRISAVFPGKDGHVRVCEVNIPVTKNKKTIVKTYKRPIVRISPLPVS